MEQRAGQLLEAVLDNAPVGLAFFDREHRHARVNAAYSNLTGLAPEAHLGRTLPELLGDAFDDVVDDIDRVFAAAETLVNREVSSIHGRRWLLSHFPVTVDHTVMWVGTVATEITALRRAERERIDLLAAEHRARATAERTAERLARLQVVTARLSAAAGERDVAAVVCDHGAAGLGASSGALMLLRGDGARFEMIQQAGYPANVAEDFGTFPDDAPLPACDAVRTRSMVLLNDEHERDRRYPSLAGLPSLHQAHADVPLMCGDIALGAISFAFREARAFDDDDRRFLLAIASQAAQAIERARLHVTERDLGHRQELLAEVSGIVATALDPADALSDVARLLTERFVAACAIEVVDGPAVSIGTVESERASTISIPLRARRNELGVMVLTRENDGFAAPDLALATELADRLAMALDNARAHRIRSEQAQTLQASLLPPRLPDIPGLTLDSRYQPIGDGSLVGGDFYDVFPLADGRWGLMIGDVCGQGVTAASLTSLVRFTARAAARLWSSPAEVLRFTNSALADHDLGERFCTVLLVMIEPHVGGARAVVASGGHHLPLLHRPGEQVRSVGRTGTALGLLDHATVDDATIDLLPGDTLVLFTDGVIEARQPDGDHVPDGFLEDLVAANAGGGSAAVGEAVERAVLELGGGRARDDMAVVVVGVGDPAPSMVTDGALEHRFPADAASVPAARVALRDWLTARHLVPARAHDLLIAITELVTNAVRSALHAVEVRAWTTSDAVWVEVIDDGAGFDPSIPHDVRELDPLAERGRGLFMVASLADECTIESGPTGTIVRCAVSR